MDIFTKEKRSEIMSKIKSKNTKPELAVFRELRRRKVYFQKHYKRAPGSPDVALPRKKRAVFIDGTFWHGYQFEKKRAKLHHEYWINKIETNIARDARNRRKLKKAGWKVLRVWEHDVKKKFDVTMTRITVFLQEP